MDSTITQRINRILKELFNGNKSDFARAIGVAESNIRSYVGGTMPKIDVANRIIANTAISCEWLITGQGNMLKADESMQSPKIETIYKSDPRDADLIAANKEIIETQKELIISLKQRIKDLERGGARTKPSVFHSAQSADSSYPNQSGVKPK